MLLFLSQIYAGGSPLEKQLEKEWESIFLCRSWIGLFRNNRGPQSRKEIPALHNELHTYELFILTEHFLGHKYAKALALAIINS
jgi:hypothetical protein